LGCGALAIVLALGTSGCLTKVVREPAFDQNGVKVFLREETRGGKVVDRGFSQPVTIAPVRITNILARIDVRGKDAAKHPREPAIPTDVLFAIGEGVSSALAKADSAQEVVVMATARKNTLGIFTNDYLTSLIIWVKDDRMFVYLGDLGEVQSRDPRVQPKEPELDANVKGKPEVLGGDGFATQGRRLVAAEWRAPIFTNTSAIRIRPGGEVVRRTILMESPAEQNPAAEPGPAPPPEGLSPDALRALADLEEVRRRGELTETEYQTRRREILSGKLPAAPASKPADSKPAVSAPADGAEPTTP
jgi:hypothetical protein